MLEETPVDFEQREKTKSASSSVVSKMAFLAAMSAVFSHFPGLGPSPSFPKPESVFKSDSEFLSLNDESFWSLACCARGRQKAERDEGASTDDDTTSGNWSPSARKLVSRVLSHRLAPTLEDAIVEANLALELDKHPHALEDGMGGVYRMLGLNGQSLAIFKPTDEEVGCSYNPKGNTGTDQYGARPGIGAGQAAFREVAAYILDRNGLAGVPPTTLVDCTLHTAPESRQTKRGSFQHFVSSECTSEDMGCSLFPVADVQRIALLDIRILNLDRHQGNILVSRNSDRSLRLTPIDHGCCLPEKLKVSSFEWCWMEWPQVKMPMLPEIVSEIEALNASHDIADLQQASLNLPASSLFQLHLTTAVLKAAVHSGRSLYDVAVFVSREDDSTPSPLEKVLLRARWQAAGRVVTSKASVDINQLVLHTVTRESNKYFASL